MSPAILGGVPSHSWDAETYDRVAAPQERWGAAVLDRLTLAGDELVLDAGCGSGRVTARLLERLPRGHVIALDADTAMLAAAGQRFGGDPRVELVQADLGRPLPLARPVDAILSTATFHWVRDHDALFGHLAAVLRAGGLLEAQCGGRGNLDALGEAVARTGRPWPGPWTFATAGETEARLRGAGFTEVRCWLSAEPTPFDDPSTFEDFLATVCLAPFQQREGPSFRSWVHDVAETLGSAELDYVRLNLSARGA
jgi:trans-aconitate 2-methyltransferase